MCDRPALHWLGCPSSRCWQAATAGERSLKSHAHRVLALWHGRRPRLGSGHLSHMLIECWHCGTAGGHGWGAVTQVTCSPSAGTVARKAATAGERSLKSHAHRVLALWHGRRPRLESGHLSHMLTECWHCGTAGGHGWGVVTQVTSSPSAGTVARQAATAGERSLKSHAHPVLALWHGRRPRLGSGHLSHMLTECWNCGTAGGHSWGAVT